MFNRRGTTDDELGMCEAINKQEEDGQFVGTSHTYRLKFTNSRE